MEVRDERGTILRRGERTAIGSATYHRLTEPNGPYRESVTGIPPSRTVEQESAPEFRENGAHLRHPRESKGRDYNLTLPGSKTGSCC